MREFDLFLRFCCLLVSTLFLRLAISSNNLTLGETAAMLKERFLRRAAILLVKSIDVVQFTRKKNRRTSRLTQPVSFETCWIRFVTFDGKQDANSSTLITPLWYLFIVTIENGDNEANGFYCRVPALHATQWFIATFLKTHMCLVIFQWRF